MPRDWKRSTHTGHKAAATHGSHGSDWTTRIFRLAKRSWRKRRPDKKAGGCTRSKPILDVGKKTKNYGREKIPRNPKENPKLSILPPPPKFNIAPENGWLEDDPFLLGRELSGGHVKLRECNRHLYLLAQFLTQTHLSWRFSFESWERGLQIPSQHWKKLAHLFRWWFSH